MADEVGMPGTKFQRVARVALEPGYLTGQFSGRNHGKIQLHESNALINQLCFISLNYAGTSTLWIRGGVTKSVNKATFSGLFFRLKNKTKQKDRYSKQKRINSKIPRNIQKTANISAAGTCRFFCVHFAVSDVLLQ